MKKAKIVQGGRKTYKQACCYALDLHYLCRQINKSIIILDLDPYPSILNFIAASLNGGTSWIGFNVPTAGYGGSRSGMRGS